MAKKLKQYFPYIVVLLLVPLLWLSAHQMRYLKALENIALNWRFRIRGELPSPAKLIYVDVDSKSIELMGERPFPRIFYAEAVSALFEQGQVKTIGIDIVFSDSAQSFLTDPQKITMDNQAFRQVIEEYPNLVLAAAYTPRVNRLSQGEQVELTEFPLIYKGQIDPLKNALPEQPSISLIGLTGGSLGLINVDEQLSQDSSTNWVPMFAYTPGPTYYTLALQLIRLYEGLPAEAIQIHSGALYLKSSKGEVLYKIPLERHQLVEVNWFSRFFSPMNERYSMADVLLANAWLYEGNEQEREQANKFFKRFKDAIVLIGPVDPMLQDLSPTPFDSEPVPRVGIHGNLLKTIMSGDYIKRMPILADYALTYLLSIQVFVLVLYSGRRSLWFKLGSICLLVGYAGGVFALFSFYQLIVPLITPVGASVTSAFIGLIYKLVHEEKQKGRIKNMFGTYVSPALVSQMVESQEEPTLGGVEETITAFFSDIQSFSSFSERLSPNQLVEIMNEYLSAMTDVVQEEKGTLDKYIGDAIVAMFGAPVKVEDHAYRACITAYEVQERQKMLRQKWMNEGDKWPDLVFGMQTRIGLNTGLATVGNMGSKTRFNYTMMGDNVNLAARCESGAKIYGVYTMVTESTREACEQTKQDIVFRYLDCIVVKGRSQPVAVYELVCLKHDMTDALAECLGLFNLGIESYLKQEWDVAIEIFNKASRLEPFQPEKTPGVHTNPSLVLIERCKMLRESPPAENWNGVFTMQTK